MTTTIPPLQAARAAVQRLSVQEQALLISELVQALAAAAMPPAAAAAPRGGFAQLRAVAADIHAAYPHADVGAQLDADRRERDATMRGEAHDVHA